MELVCATLRYHVNDRARVPAVFGIEIIGQNTKFFDCIGYGLNGRKIQKLIVGITAVHVIVVCTPTAAIDGHDSRVLAAREKIVTLLRLNSGLELQKLIR